MKKILLLSALVICFMCAPFAEAFAQDVQLTRWVVGSGGMVMQKNSEGIEMSGITGQIAIEKVSEDGMDVYQGFWVPEETTTGVEEQINAANSAQLKNFPNPFANQTTIQYQLEKHANVTIRIYDVMGNVIREVYSGEQSSGVHEILWEAQDLSGQSLSSGSYIFELNVKPMQGGQAFVVRNMMVVLK